MKKDRLIDIRVEENEIMRIKQRLGELQGKSPSILKKQINNAAAQMKRSLSREAKKKYVNTDVNMFREAMEVKKATVGNLEAMIEAKGRPKSLMDFKVTSSGEGGVLSAKALRKSGMEELINKNASPNIKAFITEFKNKKKGEEESERGRTAVVQRVEKGKVPASSTLGRRYIRELKGPSIPHMLGLRTFPETAKEDTLKQLHEDIEKHIAQVLGG